MIVFLALAIPVVAFAQWEDPMFNIDLMDSGLPDGSVFGIGESLMFWILGILGFFAIIAFCISGIMYLTSAGDEDRQKKAKSAMVYAIVGVVVALGGYIIWQAVQALLTGDTGSATF